MVISALVTFEVYKKPKYPNKEQKAYAENKHHIYRIQIEVT